MRDGVTRRQTNLEVGGMASGEAQQVDFRNGTAGLARVGTAWRVDGQTTCGRGGGGFSGVDSANPNTAALRGSCW
jgi:hypothetical protein